MNLTGTESNDYIWDTSANDVINALGGNDTIEFSQGGQDTLDGGSGTDTLTVGSNVSQLVLSVTNEGPSQTGTLTYTGSGQGTATFSNVENFSIYAAFNRTGFQVTTGAGADTFSFFGAGNNNHVVNLGGGSEDTIVADMTRFDNPFGAPRFPVIRTVAHATDANRFSIIANGDQTVDYMNAERLVYRGYDGADQITGLSGDDQINAYDGANVLFGMGGNDNLHGGIDYDILDGGEGNDFLNLREGAGEAFGGTGHDTLGLAGGFAVFDVESASFTQDSDGGYSGSIPFGSNSITISSIESFNLTLDSNNQSIRTGAGNDIVDAGGGTDTIRTGAGNDRLIADTGFGAASLFGGAGNDVYLVDASDTITELAGEGIDEVITTAGSRTDYSALYVLPANVENLTGGPFASSQGVYGNDLDNVITMQSGNDLVALDGGGIDTVVAGAGDDYIYFGATFTNADKVNGGEGNDTLGLIGSYAVTFDTDDLVSVENVAVYSSGDAEAPNAYYLTFLDSHVAAGQRMTVIAQSLQASETLYVDGSAETDGTFSIKGGNGADSIVTGAGADVIWGNFGADMLTGGAGNDLFVYQAAGESTEAARDSILDFSAGDRIGLRVIDADGNSANGDTKFTFIGGEVFTNQAGELRVSQDSALENAWLVEGDTNGDGTADFALYVIAEPGQILGATDFIL